MNNDDKETIYGCGCVSVVFLGAAVVCATCVGLFTLIVKFFWSLS